jgi:hypothetical protein
MRRLNPESIFAIAGLARAALVVSLALSAPVAVARLRAALVSLLARVVLSPSMPRSAMAHSAAAPMRSLAVAAVARASVVWELALFARLLRGAGSAIQAADPCSLPTGRLVARLRAAQALEAMWPPRAQLA